MVPPPLPCPFNLTGAFSNRNGDVSRVCPRNSTPTPVTWTSTDTLAEGDLNGNGSVGIRDAIQLRNAFTTAAFAAAAIATRTNPLAVTQQRADLPSLRVERHTRQKPIAVDALDQTLAQSTDGNWMLEIADRTHPRHRQSTHGKWREPETPAATTHRPPRRGC